MNKFSELVLKFPDRLVPPGPWVGHIPFAYFLIDFIRPKTIVELGTHTGNSLCCFAEAATISHLEDCKIFSIDTWEGDPQAGFYGEKVYEDLYGYINIKYPEMVKLLRKYFNDALNDFSNNQIDLLHIDGLHTYDAVKSDFYNWLPKMKTTGMVMFHDTMVIKDGFGVNKFWNELIYDYKYHFSFENSNGLGILSLDINENGRGPLLIKHLSDNRNLIELFSFIGSIYTKYIDNNEELIGLQSKYNTLYHSKRMKMFSFFDKIFKYIFFK